MAAGPESSGVQREARVLVTLLDLSEALSQSLRLESPAQQVESGRWNPLPMLLPLCLQLSVGQCLDNVTTFLNSYLLLQQTNSVGVCLAHQGGRSVPSAPIISANDCLAAVGWCIQWQGGKRRGSRRTERPRVASMSHWST